MAGRQLCIHGLCFAAASCLLLAWLRADARPKPFYPTYQQNPSHPVHAISASTPLAMRLALPGRAPDHLLLPTEIDAGSASLNVRVYDAVSGELLAERAIAKTGVARIDLGGSGGVRELLIRFDSPARGEESAPRVYWANGRPRHPARATLNGVPIEELPALPNTGPVFLLGYAQPTRLALLGWPAAALVFAWALRDPRRRGVFVAALALCATASSVLLWQDAYSVHLSSWDADRYGENAQRLADYLTRPETRAGAGAWYARYPHSHTSLAPALLAPAIALGVPMDLAYLELSALSGFLSLAILLEVLLRQLRVPYGVALSAVAAFGCHPILLEAFARLITDCFGLLLALAPLPLLAARARRTSRGQTAALALLAFLLPLSRPQGWSYWVFVAGALAATDRWRTGRLDPGRLLRTQLAVFALPLLALAALYLHFGWIQNVQLMLRKAQLFHGNTLGLLALSLATSFQAQPLLWLRLPAALRERALWLWLGWLLFYLATLVAARAVFFPRHFLPALPAAYALSAASLALYPRRARAAGLALLAAGAIYGVGDVANRILGDPGLPFIYWY